MRSSWESWLLWGGEMPVVELPDIAVPIGFDSHVHVYEYMMEEDEDGGVLDDDICKICKKSWNELEKT